MLLCLTSGSTVLRAVHRELLSVLCDEKYGLVRTGKQRSEPSKEVRCVPSMNSHCLALTGRLVDHALRGHSRQGVDKNEIKRRVVQRLHKKIINLLKQIDDKYKELEKAGE